MFQGLANYMSGPTFATTDSRHFEELPLSIFYICRNLTKEMKGTNVLKLRVKDFLSSVLWENFLTFPF